MIREFDQVLRIFERIRRGEGRFKDFHYLKLMIEWLRESYLMSDHFTKPAPWDVSGNLYELCLEWSRLPGDWEGDTGENGLKLIKNGQYFRIVKIYRTPDGREGYRLLKWLWQMDEGQAKKLFEDMKQKRAEIRADDSEENSRTRKAGQTPGAMIPNVGRKMRDEFDHMQKMLERIRRGEGRFKDFHYLKLMIEWLREFDRVSDSFWKPVPREIERRLCDLYNDWRGKPGDWKGGEEDRFKLRKTGQYFRIVEKYRKPNGRRGYRVLISLGRVDEGQASKLLDDLRQGRAGIRTDEYGHKYVKRLSSLLSV